jgi:hypothetical protein
MSKFILTIEIVLTTFLIASGLWGITAVGSMLFDTVSQPWHGYLVGVATALFYVALTVDWFSLIESSYRMYRLARHKAKIDTYAVRDHAQSAMHEFRTEAQAWHDAVNILERKS